jgi:hypothetical protein
VIDGILNLIGKQAKILSMALVVLVVANVVFQFYTHKTTALTPWKGGGFGMYTETHVDNRTVWLTLEGSNGIAEIRVYPENDGIRTWIEGVSLKGGKTLQSISNQAAALRYFPNKTAVTELVHSASAIGWLDMFTGGVIPKEGQTFKPSDIRVMVYETMQDMASQTFKRRIVYASEVGGQ